MRGRERERERKKERERERKKERERERERLEELKERICSKILRHYNIKRNGTVIAIVSSGSVQMVACYGQRDFA